MTEIPEQDRSILSMMIFFFYIFTPKIWKNRNNACGFANLFLGCNMKKSQKGQENK